MRKGILAQLIPIYIPMLCVLLLVAQAGSHAISTLAENSPITGHHCIIIDAGHGGVDGGATSCTGVLESYINLEISQRLDDLMHLIGIQTVMIRNKDVSIYTEGESIAAKKASDLKQRVKLVNETENAILISIHQNYFSDMRYGGAQVFYASTPGSDVLAKKIQSSFVNTINPGSKRQAKHANGVYLMQHITCTGVLVECGFLSNPPEEAKLRSKEYQLNVCCVIASSCSAYLYNTVT